MASRYPRIRPFGPPLPSGELEAQLLAREVVRIAFYLPHDHPELAAGVGHALDSFMRAVGDIPGAISHAHFNDEECDRPLAESWDTIRELLRPEPERHFVDEYSEALAWMVEKRGYAMQLRLTAGEESTNGYQFCYQARIPLRTPLPGRVSLLSATVPTEYLEAHGAERVYELALDMATHLRFATGHAGLALHLYWPVPASNDATRSAVLLHPGFDLRPAWGLEKEMGHQIDGVHWLNFLTQPVLDQFGGVAGLRSRLFSPETCVRELVDERLVVSLGEWPDAGNLSSGQDLPAYRELARVLDPRLEPLPRMPPAPVGSEPSQQPRYSSMRFTAEEARRWWRRFLD